MGNQQFEIQNLELIFSKCTYLLTKCLHCNRGLPYMVYCMVTIIMNDQICVSENNLLTPHQVNNTYKLLQYNSKPSLHCCQIID